MQRTETRPAPAKLKIVAFAAILSFAGIVVAERTARQFVIPRLT
jgi:hypothetical protein